MYRRATATFKDSENGHSPVADYSRVALIRIRDSRRTEYFGRGAIDQSNQDVFEIIVSQWDENITV